MEESVQIASLPRRLLAYLVDWLIILLVSFLLAGLLALLLFLTKQENFTQFQQIFIIPTVAPLIVALLLHRVTWCIYCTYFLSLPSQATPG
ncbi:hypothetical protein BIY23_01490 [Wolbachia pipientis]|uniref:RDD domain-containing protein n=1 Tax=Wolbachia pipientis TaxID=955 RepID=A0A1E7QLC1_WOLPI|nr:hypothetical protein BIY23_01490 [Wolbachia pipientis]